MERGKNQSSLLFLLVRSSFLIKNIFLLPRGNLTNHIVLRIAESAKKRNEMEFFAHFFSFIRCRGAILRQRGGGQTRIGVLCFCFCARESLRVGVTLSLSLSLSLSLCLNAHDIDCSFARRLLVIWSKRSSGVIKRSSEKEHSRVKHCFRVDVEESFTCVRPAYR